MSASRRFSWFVASIAIATTPAIGQVKMTTKKALELAFPQCKFERKTITLSAKQRLAIARLSGRKFTKSMAFAYIARRDKKVVGTAWFDVHKVRSKRQLLMVIVTPQVTVDRVEVLAFAEPKKYATPERWLRKLGQKKLGRLRAGKDIPRITGATLTVRATTRCVKRILSLHQVVFGKPPPEPEPKKQQKGTRR
jgi:FMN-binding domain